MQSQKKSGFKALNYLQKAFFGARSGPYNPHLYKSHLVPRGHPT